MIELVSLDTAKDHLRVDQDDSAHDNDIIGKIVQASAIVLDYIERKNTDEWEIDTSPIQYDIPPLIQAATLLVLGDLFLSREASTGDPLSDTVKNLLRRWRDPALA